jgi:hypothetical protein
LGVYVPFAQLWQATAPVTAAYVPTAHCAHASTVTMPTAVLKVPALQLLHARVPFAVQPP